MIFNCVRRVELFKSHPCFYISGILKKKAKLYEIGSLMHLQQVSTQISLHSLRRLTSAKHFHCKSIFCLHVKGPLYLTIRSALKEVAFVDLYVCDRLLGTLAQRDALNHKSITDLVH